MTHYPTYRPQHLIRMARRGERKSLMNALTAEPDMFNEDMYNQLLMASMNNMGKAVYQWLVPRIKVINPEAQRAALAYATPDELKVLLKNGWVGNEGADYHYYSYSDKSVLSVIPRHKEGWEKGVQNLLIAHKAGLALCEKSGKRTVFEAIATIPEKKWRDFSNVDRNIADVLLEAGIPLQKGPVHYEHALMNATSRSHENPELLVSMLRFYSDQFTPAYVESNLNAISSALGGRKKFRETLYQEWALLLFSHTPSIMHPNLKDKLQSMTNRGLPEDCVSVFERRELQNTTISSTRSSNSLRRL